MGFTYDKKIIEAIDSIEGDIDELLDNAETFAGCCPESSPQRDGVKKQIIECLRAWVCHQLILEGLQRKVDEYESLLTPGLKINEATR